MLAGCDRLTIGPALLQELQDDNGTLSRQLNPETATTADVPGRIGNGSLGLQRRRHGHRETGRRHRGFAADQVELESRVRQLATTAA